MGSKRLFEPILKKFLESLGKVWGALGKAWEGLGRIWTLKIAALVSRGRPSSIPDRWELQLEICWAGSLQCGMFLECLHKSQSVVFVKELQPSGKRRWKVSSRGTRSHQLLTRPRVNLFSRRRGRWIRLVQSTRWRTALQQHVRRSAWCNEVVANFFLRTVEHKISKNHLQWSPSFLHWPVTIVLKPYYLLRNPRAASLRPAERHQSAGVPLPLRVLDEGYLCL